MCQVHLENKRDLSHKDQEIMDGYNKREILEDTSSRLQRFGKRDATSITVNTKEEILTAQMFGS